MIFLASNDSIHDSDDNISDDNTNEEMHQINPNGNVV